MVAKAHVPVTLVDVQSKILKQIDAPQDKDTPSPLLQLDLFITFLSYLYSSKAFNYLLQDWILSIINKYK